MPETDLERKPLHITSNKEEIYRSEDSIFIRLPPGRNILSTSWMNGGYQEGLIGVFNHQPPHHATCSHSLKGGSVEAYLGLIADGLGFTPQNSAGLLTAAKMKHAAIVTRAFRGVEVTAVITGGIEVNGGRAGDPASYFQENGQIEKISGTINTLLIIGAHLPAYALTKAVTTATEAKTAALQELMAQSKYSTGIATGSGTDGIAIISDTTHEKYLTDAGKHSKLGELIGVVIKEATKKALKQQSELSPESQADIMVRLSRFGIREEEVWNYATRLDGENRRPAFFQSLHQISRDPHLLSGVTAIIHIIDEISWELLPETAGKEAARIYLRVMPEMCGLTPDDELGSLLKEESPIIELLMKTLAWIIKNRNQNI